MEFLEFIIVSYKRPRLEVQLKTIPNSYTRGSFEYDIFGSISKVCSHNCFEFEDDILFIHGWSNLVNLKRQIGVRNFIQHNTARVICNKFMKGKF